MNFTLYGQVENHEWGQGIYSTFMGHLFRCWIIFYHQRPGYAFSLTYQKWMCESKRNENDHNVRTFIFVFAIKILDVNRKIIILVSSLTNSIKMWFFSNWLTMAPEISYLSDKLKKSSRYKADKDIQMN